MYYKKKTLVIALLIVALMIPISSFDVSGDKEYGKKRGNTAIDVTHPDHKVKSKNNNKLLEVLDFAYENASDDDEMRNKIENIVENMKEQKEPKTDSEKEKDNRKRGIASNLTDRINAQERINGQRTIPFKSIGYNERTEFIEVGIDTSYVTEQNMIQYDNIIRELIGSEDEVLLFSESGSPKTADCENVDDDCTELSAGTKIEVTNHLGCTEGMSATYQNKTGFITAGHCADGETGSVVGQPTISRLIGNVLEELFDENVDDEDCDCAFISVNSTLANMTSTIRHTSYNVTETSSPSVDDYVKIIGVSGSTIGQITDTCKDYPFPSKNNTQKCLVTVDKAAVYGDSGGVVIGAFTSTPKLYGMITSTWVDDDHDLSMFVIASQIESKFSNISWDFGT